MNHRLYRQTFVGTKNLIENFLKEVCQCLKLISEVDENIMSDNSKFEFFALTRHNFGRTALMFSGGAIMGLYHLGVIKCLFEEGILPRIISGSSSGSLVAAFLCSTILQDVPKVKFYY